MLITLVSTWSGKERTMEMDVTPEQIASWEEGELIQNVMPELTDDEREFLITGMTPEEWEEFATGIDTD